MIFLILKILSIIVFGYSFLHLLRFKGEWMEKLGLSFLLGSGLITLIYFLYIWGTNKVSSVDFWCITVLLTIMCYIFGGSKFKLTIIDFSKIKLKSNTLTVICWTIIVVLFLSSIIYTSDRPPYTNDTLYLFDFRAKVMFLSHHLSEIGRIVNWYSYPMFTSMVGLIWRFLGTDNPSTYYPILYFSFALVFYSVLKKVVSMTLANIGTLFMYTTPITFWQAQMDGMTNIPYTVFLCLSILYLYKIIISKKLIFSDLIISSLFLGLSAWTRGSEPLWVIPVFIATWMLLFREKWKMLLAYNLVFFIIREVWPLYVGMGYTSINTAQSVIVKSALQNDMGQYGFFPSLAYTVDSILTLLPQSLGLVFYLFIAFLFLNVIFRKFSKDQLYYLFVIVMMLAALFLGSLFMVINFHIRIHLYNDSLSRLFSVFVPLMWFYIMINPGWKMASNLFKLRLK